MSVEIRKGNKQDKLNLPDYQRTELLVLPLDLNISIYNSMATTRLRRAFRYPEDSGDERGREELDEEGLFDPAVDPSIYYLSTCIVLT